MNIFYVYALHKRRTLFYTEIRIFVHVNPRFKRKKKHTKRPIGNTLNPSNNGQLKLKLLKKNLTNIKINMDKGFLQIPVLTLPYKQQKVLTKRTNIALSSGDLVKQIQMNRLVLFSHILW